MTDLLDDDTLLPRIPWEKIWKLLRTAGSYRETYCEAHRALLLNGFTFEEIPFGVLGSEEQLLIFSHFDPDHPELYNAWITDYKSEEFLPRAETTWQEMDNTIWLLAYPETPVHRDDDAWLTVLENPFIAGTDDFQFSLGIMQRVLWKYIQHRVAKMLENIFCLDARGPQL